MSRNVINCQIKSGHYFWWVMNRLAYVLIGIIGFTSQAHGLTCKDRVAIAPPPVQNIGLAKLMTTRAAQQMMKSFNLKCSLAIAQDRTIGPFEAEGFSIYSNVDVNEIEYERVERIEAATDATHLMFLEVKKETIKAKLYRIDEDDLMRPRLKLVKTSVFKVTEKEQNRKLTSSARQKLSDMVPNAFSIGYSQTTVPIEFKEGYEEVESEQALLPKVLQSVGFKRISHPSVFTSEFDGTYGFGWGFFGFAVNQENTFREIPKDDATAEVTRKISIKVTGACGDFSIIGDLHTPLGTSYLTAGPALCLYQSQVDSEPTAFKANINIRLGFGHRVFLTQKLFAAWESDSIAMREYIYQSEYGENLGISRFNIVLGWYLPDASGILR